MPVESRILREKVERVPAVVRSVLEEELLAMGAELERLIKLNIREQGAVATGQMMGSYAVSDIGTRNVISVRVGTPVEYGNYVEFGTQPHVPPLEPILRWVENKLNVVAVGVTFKSGKAAPTGKATRQFSRIRNIDKRRAAILKIANAVRFALGKKGLRARRFVRDALESMQVKHVLNNYVYEVDVIDALAQKNEFWRKVKERLQ